MLQSLPSNRFTCHNIIINRIVVGIPEWKKSLGRGIGGRVILKETLKTKNMRMRAEFV
jgi:hypothetical protein